MPITQKQRIAMAAIVAIGVAAGAAVLLAGNHAPVSSDAHGHEEERGQKEPSRKEGQAKVGVAGKADARPAEGLVKLDEATASAAGIGTAPAGPAKLQSAQEFPGEIRFNEDRTAHVVPRLNGVAENVPANLGQVVREGQLLAVIASPALSEQRSELLTAQRRLEAARVTHDRERKLWEEKISAEQDYLQAKTALREAEIAVANSGQKLAAVGAPPASRGLNRFEARAPFDGTIVEKHLTLGEAVKEDSRIFTISDLSSVWAEFAVGPRDLDFARVGQKVVVSSTASQTKVQGVISYVGALLGEQTRTARARVTLSNPQGAWRPGLFVTVTVLGSDQDVALAVPVDALQTIENRPTVFKVVPGGFQATPVQPGRSDGRNVEILGGLQAGEKVATSNAFVLKAELGKAGTAHTH
ncbi:MULTISPECIES: efflux RND transporter periplasmic adaptor subunit [Ramlibacter]|uniref:Efflux RND transporter periplasmic adaptor subunit n=1 Tax=Ramlibacter pinisoli TaxID=2682844 RepID=A0A6N8IRV2_9BURK|nr:MULTISPECIES: efflux RND transporter periplasmic adaptor subunit [Ramlibacter]MBA2964673.1 efflux RND transporter periplasmic adaptor subunit [Ramlibacter sp. CGMCC 1.13660]MVQ29639.1 efflux RND transporter periplasmic adaptor subunit [Ramlibacter pinisoli]